MSLWAFVRKTTNQRISETPLTLDQAFTVMAKIQRMPKTRIVESGRHHAEILQRMASEGHCRGPRLSDAVLAAIAVENGAKLASTDQDFARFPALRWINPLAAPLS